MFCYACKVYYKNSYVATKLRGGCGIGVEFGTAAILYYSRRTLENMGSAGLTYK